MPLLTHLHKEYPGVLITWVCGEQVRPLLESTGLIHEVIVINDKKLLIGSFFSKIRVLFSLWIRLFLRSFDLCLTAYSDPRYKLLSLTTLSKIKRGFYRDYRGAFPIPGRYHTYEYLRLIRREVEPLNLIPEFPKLNLPKYEKGGKPRIILAPGGARNLLADSPMRRWPIESYRELLRLLNTLPVEIMITGAESDKWVTDYFTDSIYTNLIGKLSLLELVGLLEGAELLITHDSGPLHLGKLVNIPTIALFGPTNPLEFVGPKLEHGHIKVLWGGENLLCSPCYDGKCYAKCSTHECLKNINPQDVFQYVVSRVKSSLK